MKIGFFSIELRIEDIEHHAGPYPVNFTEIDQHLVFSDEAENFTGDGQYLVVGNRLIFPVFLSHVQGCVGPGECFSDHLHQVDLTEKILFFRFE